MAGDLPRIVNRYPVTYPLDFNLSNEQPQEGPHVSLYSIMIMHRVTIFSEYITLTFSRYFLNIDKHVKHRRPLTVTTTTYHYTYT